MLSYIIRALRRFYRSSQINPEQQQGFPSDLITELEDSRKFSLNSLTTLLAILAVSGSKTLQPAVLTLFIYTINLRLTFNVCFLENHPTLSRFLHVVPLLGTSCIAGVVLVTGVQSPVLATAGILLGVLPLVTVAIHLGRQRMETPAAVLPVQVRQVPVSASADSTLVSN